MTVRELLIGCGRSREKKIALPGSRSWTNLVTLDIDPAVGCDVTWDLHNLPLPFENDTFAEIHAYEVLEHTGRQGDWKFFFDQWSEFWRILRPNGLFIGTSPIPSGAWAWGDPGHTRIISPECMIFLDQAEYAQIERGSPMTDYRPWYKADFKRKSMGKVGDASWYFILTAIKEPSDGQPS